MANVLAFAGSLRRDSWNKKLVRAAAAGATNAGANVTLIDVADYPLPVYDGDLEASDGLPENAKKLKALFGQNDALLIASPEYNASITAALKNAIDWVSRPDGDEPPLASFAGKTAALIATSPGGLGGLRGLVHARAILSSIRVLVIPDQIAVAKAHEAFDESGQLKDAKMRARVEAIGAALAATAQKLS